MYCFAGRQPAAHMRPMWFPTFEPRAVDWDRCQALFNIGADDGDRARAAQPQPMQSVDRSFVVKAPDANTFRTKADHQLQAVSTS